MSKDPRIRNDEIEKMDISPEPYSDDNNPPTIEKIRIMMRNMTAWWNNYDDDELVYFFGYLVNLIHKSQIEKIDNFPNIIYKKSQTTKKENNVTNLDIRNKIEKIAKEAFIAGYKTAIERMEQQFKDIVVDFYNEFWSKYIKKNNKGDL